MINNKTYNQNYWDFICKEGWIIGVALDHYFCQRIIPHYKKDNQVSDTVELRHQSITTPSATPEYHIIHGLNTLTGALTVAPTAKYDTQLQAITDLHNVCASWYYSSDTPGFTFQSCCLLQLSPIFL